MAQILIELDDHLLARAANEAVEQQTPLARYLAKVVEEALEGEVQVKPLVDIEDVAKSAVDKAKKLPSNTIFFFEDVCQEWGEIDGNVRKVLGKMFRRLVEASKIATYHDRTSANKARYRRLRYSIDRDAVEQAPWGEWRLATTESAAVAKVRDAWPELTGGQGGPCNIWFALDAAQTFRVAEVEAGLAGENSARYRMKPRITVDDVVLP